MMKLFNKLFNKKINKTPIVEEWYADYRMEDGQTGRIYSSFEIDSVENAAYNRGHNAIYWSIKGGEWFNSWEETEG